MTTFQPPRAGERMIPVEEAQQRVLAEVSLVGTETVAFTEAPGRVLREDVRATNDVPQGDNTAMDGYAVRAADIPNPPVRLRVIEDLNNNDRWDTGDYWKHLQPEKIYNYNDQITLRANWDLEIVCFWPISKR